MKIVIDELGSKDDSDIYVFYCKNLEKGDVLGDIDTANGWSLFKEAKGYNGNCFINTHRRFPNTLAHELGHLLTKNRHYGEEYESKVETYLKKHNLMSKSTTIGNDIGDSKRLYLYQENLIFTQP